MVSDWQNGGFGIYIHWPFCQAKCPYCDFNSHVSRSIDNSAWQQAYLSELSTAGDKYSDRRVDSVFFGGGTPSMMPETLVSAILDKINDIWGLSAETEVTLEANPTSIEAARFRGYRTGGVNRVSVGIQSLNDDHLKALGRLHSVQEALSALDVARDVFDRVSFDLIYARQDQSIAQWRHELRTALSFDPDHLSLYQLTIEAGTAFGKLHDAGSLRGLPSDTLAADMYFETQYLCQKAGLPAYEVSNHSRLGSESRHNLIYWRYGDYLGIGPGAHGRLTDGACRCATESFSEPTKWLAQVDKASGYSNIGVLSSKDQALEMLMMGLRLNEGVSLDRLNKLSKSLLNNDKISSLQSDGYLEDSSERLIVSQKGRIILNSIIGEIIED